MIIVLFLFNTHTDAITYFIKLSTTYDKLK